MIYSGSSWCVLLTLRHAMQSSTCQLYARTPFIAQRFDAMVWYASYQPEVFRI